MSAEHALLHAAVALFAYRRRLSMTYSTEEAAEAWWQLSTHLDQWINQYHLAGPPASDAAATDDGLATDANAAAAAAAATTSATADATARTLLLLRTVHVLLHQCALLCKCVQRHSAGITAILARWAILLQPYEAGPPTASPTAIMTCSVDDASGTDSLGVTLSATSSAHSHQFHSEAVSDLDNDDDQDDGDGDSDEGGSNDDGTLARSDDDDDDDDDDANDGGDGGDAASSDAGMAGVSRIPYPVAPTYQPAWQSPAPHAIVRASVKSGGSSSSASSTGSAVVVASRGSSTTSPPEMTPSPPQRPRSHHAPRPANAPPAEPGRRPPFPAQVRAKLYGWLHAHAHDPYPSIREKEHLVAATGITMAQLNNWLINARRRALPVRPYPASKASASARSTDRRRR